LKSYSSREVIARLQDDGWRLITVEGSHHHFKHPVKKGKTTVKHPCKDIPPKLCALLNFNQDYYSSNFLPFASITQKGGACFEKAR